MVMATTTPHINNKDGDIDGMLRQLGHGKKIGATFRFSIPVSLPGPLHQQKTCKKNDE